MSFWANINDESAVRGDLYIPKFGLWTADVLLSSEKKLSGACVLTVGDLSLKGFAFRSGAFGGSRGFRLIGGLGGWHSNASPRAYRSVTGVKLSMVLSDLALEVGEQIGALTEKFLGGSLVRFAGPASDTVRALSRVWRVDALGVTHFTDWPDAPVKKPFTPSLRGGAEGLVEIATESPAEWLPGALFASPIIADAPATSPLRVECARHVWQSSGVSRVEVMTL